MIEYAHEIPTCKLSEWSKLADLDFVLAHVVLNDKDYAEFFLNRPEGRELILDNSLHELGFALPMDDLYKAAQLCKADYVISPDNVNDSLWTIGQYHVARTIFKQDYKLAVVWTGFRPHSDLFEREHFLEQVLDADMLCCTFKLKDRLRHFQQSFLARSFKRVHLLGVDSLSELADWNLMAKYLKSTGAEIKWSVDTGKALKWALRGRKLDELESLRSDAAATAGGKPSVASQHILSLRHQDITLEALQLFVHNVSVLREVCR